MAPVLGVDFGASGIKGAPVDPESGELLAERFRIETPETAKPKQVADVFAEIARHFSWSGPIGCGFPGVVRRGIGYTAANIHRSWIGTDIAGLFSEKTGCPTTVINDADAAGLAEMKFGAGRGRKGVVILLTLGTGIGSAIFTDGVLIPNTEFGHLQIREKDAERRASDAVRQEKNLSWEQWAIRLNEFLHAMEALFWPDLIIIGGGVSKYHELFFPYLEVKAEVVPAQFLNLAGIVGAGLAACTSTYDAALRQAS
ncbi:MAG TPA: ROK family protein [Anaerolineaceae bacterium]|nr:ROK family protein [Anaerolineaceae bacterium]